MGWGEAWGSTWDGAWGVREPVTWSTWGVSWGQAWSNAWGYIAAPTVLYQDQAGGDDAPPQTRSQHEREAALSDELEQTMRALLWHPKTVAAVATSVADTREATRLRQRHAAATTLVQTRARLADEQDDEEWILMS